MKLRRIATSDQIIDLPSARLVPDLRDMSVDQVRLASTLVGSAGDDRSRIERVVGDYVRNGGALGRMLLEQGGVDERTFAFTVARQLQIPLADFRDKAPEQEATAWLQANDAHRLGILPVSYDGTALTVALIDPLDREVTAFLGRLPVVQVNVTIAPAFEIRARINQLDPVLAEVERHVKAFAASEEPPRVLEDAFLGDSNDDAPIIQVVNKIVTQALRDRASDVHIEPTDGYVRVRYRVDGALKEVLTLPAAMGPALASRIKIMADLNIVERRRPQDGQFQMEVDGRDLDVRVSTTSTLWGENTVLRLLDKRRSLFRLADLGMPAATHELYQRMVTSPYGMVLVSGPTGSGKTTTLYATLAEIIRPDINVMTIEDPVEYVVPAINQIQISEQAGLSFAGGLKSILRQDPDVILVGEVRDVETARIAVQSALTGHLVLSSLHATDSIAALYRLLDMGIESFLITSAMIGVVAQRLVRRICESCAAPYEPTLQELAIYRKLGGSEKRTWLKGEGCSFCSGTGYFDRVGVYEVLEVTDEIRQYVVDGRQPRETRELAVAQGLRTLQSEAVRLVDDDKTTIDELLRNVFVMGGGE